MNMKMDSVAVMVFNKSGGCYQAALSDDEQRQVGNLISKLHSGQIKIIPNKLPIEFTKRKKPVKTGEAEA